MQRTCALTILGCIVFSLLSATAGLGAATGTLAEADGLLNSPALSMTQATRALSLYQGLLSTAGRPGPWSWRTWAIPASFWANWSPRRKLWGTTSRGSPTPRP